MHLEKNRTYARTFPVQRKEINVITVLFTMTYSSRKLNNKKAITTACNFWRPFACSFQVSSYNIMLSASTFLYYFLIIPVLLSTETALVRVQNDILCAIDNNESVILLLLDLSAAFDTVDHSILLSRLRDRFGVNGTAAAWFESYLTSRTQFVRSMTVGQHSAL